MNVLTHCQVGVVKTNTVVAILGQKGKESSQLWFLLTNKKSYAEDPFIEGRWLHKVHVLCDASCDVYEVRHAESIQRLDKSTILDCVWGCIEDREKRGHVSIPLSTIEDLNSLLAFEDDVYLERSNPHVLEVSGSGIESNMTAKSDLLLTNLHTANEWKRKVRPSPLYRVTMNLYDDMSESVNTLEQLT